MLPSHCPWSTFAPEAARFCEDAVACAWVAEPANTWSNIGFVIVAAAIWTRRDHAPRTARRFAAVALFLGVGSAAFHATRTWLGGALDSAAMQAAAALVIVANARRAAGAVARGADDHRDDLVLAILAAAGTLLVLGAEHVSRAVFAVEMAIAGALELIVILGSRTLVRAHRWLALSWLSFAPAYVMWWLDVRRIACEPSAHVLNGHAAWHVLLAASLFCFYRFHEALAAGAEITAPSPPAVRPATPARHR